MTWRIALYSTNTYYPPDTNGEVSLATLGTSDPMTDPNWLKLDILGAGFAPSIEGDDSTTVGGVKVINPRVRRTLEIKVAPIVFPDDVGIIVAIGRLLRNRYCYIYRGTYDFAGLHLHGDGKAVPVVIELTIEHDYESGTKLVTMKCDYAVPSIP